MSTVCCSSNEFGFIRMTLSRYNVGNYIVLWYNSYLNALKKDFARSRFENPTFYLLLQTNLKTQKTWLLLLLLTYTSG